MHLRVSTTEFELRTTVMCDGNHEKQAHQGQLQSQPKIESYLHIECKTSG
jgi:hypothetical protein